MYAPPRRSFLQFFFIIGCIEVYTLCISRSHFIYQEIQSESIENQLAEEKCLMEQKYASMLQQVLAQKQLVSNHGIIHPSL